MRSSAPQPHTLPSLLTRSSAANTHAPPPYPLLAHVLRRQLPSDPAASILTAGASIGLLPPPPPLSSYSAATAHPVLGFRPARARSTRTPVHRCRPRGGRAAALLHEAAPRAAGWANAVDHRRSSPPPEPPTLPGTR
uniref:Uncharacterized protein n=1 Tax=Arundo donax TaxID=35708 RepID=A0A0A8Y3T2_ARUDO